jgi:hypothetical protein
MQTSAKADIGQQKLSLEAKQKAATMAAGEENLRSAFRKMCTKAARSMRARDDKEKNEAYTKAVAAFLGSVVPMQACLQKGLR